jgi:outer membrane receptor protein involved in Fe transport
VKSEEGRTWTFGLVFRSPFEHALARRLTFAIDWYRAKVTGAIAQVGAQTTYDLCFNRDGVSNPTYSLDDPNGMCRRIVRDPVTGDRQYVESTYANLGTLQTSGIDVQANWGVEPEDLGLPVPGLLSLDVLFNKLLSFESQSFPTSAVLENKGTFIRDGSTSRGIFGWAVSRVVQLTAGIDNLFDRDPNRVGAGPGNNGAGTTEPAIYDVLGRRYCVSLRLNF